MLDCLKRLVDLGIQTEADVVSQLQSQDVDAMIIKDFETMMASPIVHAASKTL